MEPSLNTWTSFFLIAVVQGFFLSLMIFLRRSKANNLLGLLVLLFSTCLLYYVAFWTRYSQLLPWPFHAIQGLTYTFGPLLYSYVRADKKEAKISFLHFIPAGLFVIFFFLMPYYPRESLPLIRGVQSVVQTLHLIVYALLTIKYTYSNKGYSNGALKLYQWRRKLSWSFLGYTFTFLCYYLLLWTGYLEIEYDYGISIASTFFIYFIGYHGFQHQEIFKMYEVGRYEKSALNSSASVSILNSLKAYMESERPYLDSSLRLQDLADHLKISPNYISQVINDIEGHNFADFVNEYRIREAKKLLLDSVPRKIIHIAYDSGFNNKTSFNNAFKRFTGMVPSEFREKQSVLA